jgi:hypothetical protein
MNSIILYHLKATKSTYSGDDGPATSAGFGQLRGICGDSSGAVYVLSQVTNRLRRIDPITTIITTYAGKGTSGTTGDGGKATSAQIKDSFTCSVDTAGNVYIAETLSCVIRRVTASDKNINRFAGIVQDPASAITQGDGGKATAAYFTNPNSVYVDSAANVYFVEYASRVRKVSASGNIISTFAGSAASTAVVATSFTGSDGFATSAQLLSGTVMWMTGDTNGNMFIGIASQVLKVDRASSKITIFGGSKYFSLFCYHYLNSLSQPPPLLPMEGTLMGLL